MNRLLKQSLKPLIRTLVACLALSATHSAHAVMSWCAYKVNKVSHHQGGWIYASFASLNGSVPLDYVQLCSVDSAAGGISTATCKAMLATLLTAKASQSTVMMWFDQPTAYSCTTTVAWANLAQSTGWYFGPSIE
jgi:hypothetical protein